MESGMKDVIFPLEFRKYQKEILKNFDSLIQKKEKRFHYVAPPGSGKTIAGLEIIRRIGEKAVVLSPNSAIQIQWMDKLTRLTDEISISTDPFSGADIVTLTYQAITVKDRETGELHTNAKAIIDELKKRRTLVLDECHHLVRYWASVINEFIDDQTYVIGLTATPPIDKSQKEINTYLTVVGDVDYQIPMPAVIKEGNLAPFQDLVYITEPSEVEWNMIEQSSVQYKSIIKKLHELEPPLTPIQIWAYERLEKYKDSKGKVIPYNKLLMEQPDLCIAFARYAQQEMGDLPLDIMVIDEMEEEPTLSDIMLVLEDYALHYLLSDPDHLPIFNELKTSLKEMGYVLSRKGLQSISKGIPTILGLSMNKMIGMKEILKREMLFMGEDLRVLILTDYEKGKHLDGTSAIAVMAMLTSDEAVDPVDPILVTGSTVLVDDDLLPRFLEYANEFIQENALNLELEYHLTEGFYEITASGSDWSTKNYVLLITQMLELGITRCLVGTRSLLGEGWDSIKLNTLIDLTLVSTFVSVNQIRGRSIRADGDNPVKVANNWDVITLVGDYEQGYYDFERFKKKHAHFYGLSHDNIIEKGIGHVHPLLTNAPIGKIYAEREHLNETMLKRSEDRFSIYERWKIGESYKGYETISIDFVPVDKTIRYQVPRLKTKKVQETRFNIKKRFKIGGYFLIPFVFIAYFIAAYFSKHSNIPLIIFSSSLLLFIVSYYFLGIRKYVKGLQEVIGDEETLEENLSQFSLCVFHGLKELKYLEDSSTEQDIQIILREDDSYRILLKDSPQSELFTRSIAEILSPIQDQKYIIERKVAIIPHSLKQWLNKLPIKYELVNYHPLPSVFAANRKNAQVFQKYWNKFISEGELIYTRRKEGKAIVQEFFRKKNLPLHSKKKEIWL